MSGFELRPPQTVTPEGETVDNTERAPLAPHYEAAGVTLFHGDCLDVLRELPDESVHAVVTDPPYGLSNTDPGHVAEAITHWTTDDRTFLPSAGGGFMGKAWDEFVPPPAVWDECMRVLKPGGHLLAFAGSRTVDLMALSVRLAGFDIRDSIAWLYGSGFPKSLDVAKAIDKASVATSLWDEVRAHLKHWRDLRGLSNSDLNAAIGAATNGGGRASAWFSDAQQRPELPSKEQWERLRGVLDWDRSELDDVYDTVKDGATRPLLATRTASRSGGSWAAEVSGGMYRAGTTTIETTAAATDEAREWEGWGTALKPAFEPIVVARKPLAGTVAANVLAHGTGALNIDASRVGDGSDSQGARPATEVSAAARYPERGSVNPAATPGPRGGSSDGRWPANVVLEASQAVELDRQAPDTGGSGRSSGPSLYGTTDSSAAYGARAGVADGYEPKFYGGEKGGASRMFPTFRYEAKAPTSERPVVDGVAHPTVKPLDLMRWLVRLVTPKGGTVLEPFAGSGTTVEACLREGFDVIAIEREADYLPLIEKRIRKDHAQGLDFDWGEAS